MIRVIKPNAQKHEPNPIQPPMYSIRDTTEIDIDKLHERWEKYWKSVMTFGTYLQSMITDDEATQ